jgi:hypothetical protein
MRVLVKYTVDASDEIRRAIRAYHGQEGLATRQEVADWYKNKGSMMDEDLLNDMDGDEDEEAGE